MYFYKLLAAGYEEHCETTYYSNRKYTQKEFENITFQTFKECCEKIIKDDPISLCYRHDFDIEYILWSETFKTKMHNKGFYELNHKLTGYMAFDITGDHYYEKSTEHIKDEYEKQFNTILNNLNIDTSCWENNCILLEENCKFDNIQEKNEEKEYCRQQCIIHYIKANQIPDKTCSNCTHPYMSCDETSNGCESWVWNGKK